MTSFHGARGFLALIFIDNSEFNFVRVIALSTKAAKYDLVVVGDGPPGYARAIKAAKLGFKVCSMLRLNYFVSIKMDSCRLLGFQPTIDIFSLQAVLRAMNLLQN